MYQNNLMRAKRSQLILISVFGGVLFLLPLSLLGQESGDFQPVEATISDIHNAIRTEQITCEELTQLYINRAKAYNGVCTQLVTEDGASVPPATGVVSGGTPLEFPTETVAVSSFLPDYDEYRGTPLDLGRMESTLSSPVRN